MADDKPAEEAKLPTDAVKDEKSQEPVAEPAPASKEPEAPTEETPDPIDWDEDEDKPKEKPEVKPKAKPKAEPKSEEKPPEEEPKQEEPKAETEGKPAEETKPKEPTKAEERKTQLNTEIRDLVAKRKALQDEVTKANAEVYGVKSIDELKEEGLSETDAKVEALRQQVEMDKYNTQIAEAQLTIESEANRVINDFPIFNPTDESFDKELSDEASELLRANLIIDENTNQVIGSNVSPYQLYKTIARAAGVSATKGQIKGKADAEKMMANADVSTNAAPPTKPKDPLMELLTEGWDEP